MEEVENHMVVGYNPYTDSYGLCQKCEGEFHYEELNGDGVCEGCLEEEEE